MISGPKSVRLQKRQSLISKMPFNISFQVENEGTTVPYLAVKDAIRHNRGLVGVRGRPDRYTDFFKILIGEIREYR
jgi:hypothetical protein